MIWYIMTSNVGERFEVNQCTASIFGQCGCEQVTDKRLGAALSSLKPEQTELPWR